MFSGTTFAPFVSAIVLPVMMQTTSIVYPIAAFVLTLLVILFHKLFLFQGLRTDEEYVPVMLNSRDDMVDTAIRILFVAAIVVTCGMLIVIHFTKMYMPPVGAITMLSMIISESVLTTYPIQIFVGSSLILFSVPDAFHETAG